MSSIIDQSKKFSIILASGSPRRKELLEQLGLKFKIETRPVQEDYPTELKHTEISDYLAQLKASAFKDIDSKTLIITGDTIVWHQEKALGKPRDYKEAVQMLESLSDRTHEVISSVNLKTKHKNITTHEITKVKFKPLTEDEISYYINTYLPYDKAGAYGIQEWIGQIGITSIEGSFYNVMGLPTGALYKALKEVLN